MSKIDWSKLPTLAPTATEVRSDAGWDYKTDSPYTITTTTDISTWDTSSTIYPSLYTTGGLVYITDGNSYTVTTEDGTTVELDVKGNSITVNCYKITTDTIKNAIKKIQEEEERL